MKIYQFTIIVLLTIIFLAGCGGGSSSGIIDIPTQIPTPTPSVKPVPHLFPALGVDSNVSIKKVNIIAGIFRASDFDFEKGSIDPKWITNLPVVMQSIKNFYEREFDSQMTVNFSIVEDVVVGKESIKDYDVWSIIEEFKQHTSQYAKDDHYNVWMIYVARDEYGNTPSGNMGAVAVMASAVQFEFWLDDEAIYEHQYGLVGSAHEYGHLLGMPHPWELAEEVTNGVTDFGGDVMGYDQGDTGGILMNYFLGDYYLEEMFKP